MNKAPNVDFNNLMSEDNFDFKKEFYKYLYFWKLFLAASVFMILIAFLYIRYTSKVYSAVAKIKIIDKKESSLDLPTASDLFSNSKINLENEIEVIKSFPIISKVVENKNLHTSVISIGDIMKSLTVNYPFELRHNIPVDSLSESSYRLNITDEGFEIIDYINDSKKYSFKGVSTYNFKHDLPFEILNFDREQYFNDDKEGYEIHFSSVEKMVASIKKLIRVSQVGKESDIIQLEFKSTKSDYAEIVLNELIHVYNNDGIQDRQLIHKRTIDFVNERYAYLSMELDSIEITKQLYKVDNDLVDLSANSAISLEQSYKSQENIFSIENQISLTNLLITTLNDSELELLPANIGIENREINSLILDYNSNILERKKLILSAGQNNPSIRQLNNMLTDGRSNIIFSLRNYLNQLKSTKQKLSRQSEKFDDQVSNLPEKEKILRAIERNQQIKETLYLFLLQKREEAEVSYAVTEPSIKVVEYAISKDKPISPRSSIIYLAAILIGLLLPFTFLYFMFYFNNRIFTKEQIEELKLPISLVGEVPEIDSQSNTLITSAKERSPLAESFRVLCSKLRFYTDENKKDGQIIMVTSTIKGEGKTFCATNLALAKSSLGKKTILIGADLHNPQIHVYLNKEKNNDGLVNYLVDSNFDWKKAILKFKDSKCDIMIGGQIPPNPAQLLNNGNLEKLINQLKKVYDYIIIDTAPILLVSDTLSISPLADLLIFVVRCDLTDTDTLEFLRDSHTKGVIKDNSLIVLNGLGSKGRYGYGYAYNYNYGYRYKYSYNYNYGYGYDYKSSE